MLQKAAGDGNDPDIFRQALDAGPEQATVTHDQVDVDPGLEGLVEGPDHVRVGERVDLALDEPATALALVLQLTGDLAQKNLFQVIGREPDEEPLQV